MKGFGFTLRATAAVTFVGLLIGTFVGSVGFSLFYLLSGEATWLSALFSIVLTYPFALGFGIAPAFLVFVPIYALLRYFGRDSYLSSIFAGLIPAAVSLAVGSYPFAALSGWYALIVAITVHHVSRTATSMAVRSNNSFKPNPLRGSA